MSPFSLSRQTTLQRAAPSADAPPPEPGAGLTVSFPAGQLQFQIDN